MNTNNDVTDDQIVSTYKRQGNAQYVASILHVGYKRVKSVLNKRGVIRPSGWKRTPFTLRAERRTRYSYGQDAED